MRSPGGRDSWSPGVFHEVRQPEKIVNTDRFSDEQGNVVPSSCYDNTGIRSDMLVTVTFGIWAERTLLKLRHAGSPAGTRQDLAQAGWNETLDKYEGILPKTVFGGACASGSAESGA